MEILDQVSWPAYGDDKDHRPSELSRSLAGPIYFDQYVARRDQRSQAGGRVHA